MSRTHELKPKVLSVDASPCRETLHFQKSTDITNNYERKSIIPFLSTHTYVFFMFFTLTLTRDREGSLEVKQFTNFWKGSTENPSPAPFLAVFAFRIEIKCHLANGKRPKSSTDLFTTLRLINGLTTSVVIYHVFRGSDEKFSTCTLYEQYNNLYSGAECRFFRVSAIL